MGHTNADVTLNVYTEAMDDSLRTAVDRVGNEWFNIVHSGEGGLDSVPLAPSEASRGAGLEPARPSDAKAVTRIRLRQAAFALALRRPRATAGQASNLRLQVDAGL
jgi:hypothetical protein